MKTKRSLRKWANIIVDSELKYAGRTYWLKDKKDSVDYKNGNFYFNDEIISRSVARDTILHGLYGKKSKRSLYSA